MNIISYSPFLVIMAIICSTIIYKERNQTPMIIKNNNTRWLASVQTATEAKTERAFHTRDKNGTPVIIEWQKTSILSSDFALSMRNIWDMARQAYTPVEMQFLRTFPEVVQQEAYFKVFEPLFANGISAVDWNMAEATMETLLKSHFVFDPMLFNDAMKQAFANDICFFVSITDKQTDKTLGFITFMIRQSYQYGDCKVMSLGVDPSCQNRGLGKLLMSSIFAILPTIERIFLCTRVTNENALAAYKHWGFTADNNPILDHPFNPAHWSFLEYKANESNILQNTAPTLLNKSS